MEIQRQEKQVSISGYFGNKEEYENFVKRWNEVTAKLNDIFNEERKAKEKYERRSSSGIKFQ